MGSGFVCEPGDPSTCPATAKSTQGDSYELSGVGSFDPQKKSVQAAGSFTHKSADGNLVETGVWLASDLLSFDSYGAAPSALLRKALPLGGPPSIRRFAMGSGPMATGGLAVLRIRLLPISGPPSTALIQMNSAIGDVPREHPVEGVRLIVEENGTAFSEEAGGRVMFLPMRAPTSASSKTVQHEADTKATGPQHN
jgi:hypothetical protein